MTSTLLALAAIFAQLSLVAMGGINSVLPEMHRQVVDVHGWMSGQQFAALFALAQAAPGPNYMVCALIGWQVAGLSGAIVSLAAMTAPAVTLTYFTAGAWHRFRGAAWRRKVQAGLSWVTVGMIAAGAVLLAQSTTTGTGAVLITVAVAGLMLSTKLHPLWLLGGAAGLGAIGLA